MSLPWSRSARTPQPGLRWPGGAPVALWVGVGVESYRPDGAHTEDLLPRGPAPDLVNAAWREYGNRVGAFRLLDGLAGIGLRPTVLLNTDVYDDAPEVPAAARALGAEIVAHGLSNSDALPDMTADEERAYVAACRARIAREEGRAPGGWSSPWLRHRPTTLAHLHAAGYRYLLDLHLDDQPVWLDAGDGRFLAIPYASELNDSTTLIGRSASATSFAQMIRDEFDGLVATGRPVVMSVVLHSFISGRPHRSVPILRALKEIVVQRDKVVTVTPGEIYEAFTRSG